MGNGLSFPCSAGSQTTLVSALELLGADDIQALRKLLETEPALLCPDRKANLLAEFAKDGKLQLLEDAIFKVRATLEAQSPDKAEKGLRTKLYSRFGRDVSPETIAGTLLNVSEPMCRSPTPPNNVPLSALLSAARSGHWEMMKWMMQQGCNVIQPQPISGYTVLHIAALHGQTEVLRQLLQCTHPVRTDAGEGPLCSSVFKPLQSGVECTWPNMHATARVTPLMLAAYHGHVECVKLLVSFGALVHARTVGNAVLTMPGRSTALHCAARQGHTEICSILLQAQVMYMGSGGNRQRTRWEGNSRLDVRIMRNTVGAIPYSYARHLHNDEILTNLLDPSIPLSAVLDSMNISSYMCVGVPTLYYLAATALRRHLLGRIAELSAKCARDKLREGDDEGASMSRPLDSAAASAGIPIGSPTAPPTASAGSACGVSDQSQAALTASDPLNVRSTSNSSSGWPTSSGGAAAAAAARPEATAVAPLPAVAPAWPEAACAGESPSADAAALGPFPGAAPSLDAAGVEQRTRQQSAAGPDGRLRSPTLLFGAAPEARPSSDAAAAPVAVGPALADERRSIFDNGDVSVRMLDSASVPLMPGRPPSPLNAAPWLNKPEGQGSWRRTTVSGASSSGSTYLSLRGLNHFRSQPLYASVPGEGGALSAPDNAAMLDARNWQASTANKRLTPEELTDLKRDIEQTALSAEAMPEGTLRLDSKVMPTSARRLFSLRSNTTNQLAYDGADVSGRVTAPINSIPFARSSRVTATADTNAVSYVAHDDSCETGSLDNCCGICLDARVEVSLRHCGHALCVACAQEILGYTSSPAACPFCRALIGDFAALG